jgi:hypothetical protein
MGTTLYSRTRDAIPAFQRSDRMNSTNDMNRREFVQQLAVLSAATTAGLTGLSQAQEGSAADSRVQAQRSAPFVGIQMGPHTMLDEGIEPCLDLIQQTAGVNAVFTYSHAFHADLRKPARVLAPDHGTPPRDNRSPLPAIWVRHHERYFKNTALRYRPVDASLEYAGRDLFAEMLEPARRRGMKVYARVLESSGREIEGFSNVVTVDVYGRPTRTACWSHPDYRNLWVATVEDMFRTYELDGFQWGAERMGPLMNVISPWNDTPPTCFCEHCRARGKARGIDPERAREGFQKLYEYVRGLMSGESKPAEGVFTVFLRHLLRYPEILAWEYQYRLSREGVMRGMYEAIKRIKPQADVGWHVDHQPSSWDLVYRAEMSYEEMAPYSDFIKLILYHAVLGPRIRDWYLRRFQRTILSELSLEQSLELYYAFFGYNRETEPDVDNLARRGFSPEYVFRETQRSVASAAGKTKIYAGIGMNVPGSPPDDPETIRRAVLKAFEAGARGIVISREYEEMRVPNLKAVGSAVKELAGR